MGRSRLACGLEPLRELPRLTRLSLGDCGYVDISPLAGNEQLEIFAHKGTLLTGEELFPPGRVVRKP
ncbi:hypothetical protein ACWGI8_19795 [Streptomyces sp. NPDC054841]